MGKRKAKSGNYWKLACIVIADYVRSLAHVQYITCKEREELDLYIQMVMNCRSILLRDGSVIIQSDKNTETNTREVLEDLKSVENNAVMRLQTLDFALDYKKKKLVVIENEEYKKLPTKLLNAVTKLINIDHDFTFSEFTHGAGTYRLIRINSSRVYSLMNYTKKTNSWTERSVFRTKKVSN